MALSSLFGAGDAAALLTTLALAAVTVAILLLAATPVAWALARASGRWKAVAEAVVALPLVLPPTVMGFYLLVLMGPTGWLGAWWIELTGKTLAFSFSGLVLAS
ncbi:MAG: molybdate ABC transporter permease subunit, partial [Pseudomonadota bacterium]